MIRDINDPYIFIHSSTLKSLNTYWSSLWTADRSIFVQRERQRDEFYVINSIKPGPESIGIIRRLSQARKMCAKLLAQGGLRQFEGRSWRGFHHHLTLCFMAHYLFRRQF